MRVALFCLLISALGISADLQSDIEEIGSHLPLKEIEVIGKQYVATYPSYADGLRFVDNVTYEKLTKNFLKTKEGRELIEYFNRRGIDFESILLVVTRKTSEMIVKWLQPLGEGDLHVPISGDIVADYKKAIGESNFINAVREKMANSLEFANLVAAFKDPEFKGLYYRSANSKVLMSFENSAAVRGFWSRAWRVIKKAIIIAAAFLK